MKQILFIVIALAVNLCSMAQSITFNIRNIRNDKGHLQVAIFENEAQFKIEKPVQKLYFDKSGISNTNKNITIDLKPGNYAISVLDDEDDSKDMTYRLGIYPREGVGFSNYKLEGMSKPKFSDFDFTVSQGNKQILVEMKYF